MLRTVSKTVDDKTELITVRVTPKMLRELKLVAEAEHTNYSNIVRQFVGRKIDAWKEKKPELFAAQDQPGQPSFTVKLKRKARQNKA